MKPKVNDLIFKELIKRGYSLRGNTRVWNIADSKLWYLTPEQAQAFLDLEMEENYRKDVIQKEIDLINDNMGAVLEKFSNGDTINIIDIGCGDGKKAVLFINKFDKGKVKIRYCPIDISNYMVEKAISKIRKMDIDEVIQFNWNISDFDNLENVSRLIRSQRPGRNLFLLLGNTLGNFEINELLYTIRSSMKENEVLIIGNGLDISKDKERILKAYNTEFLDSLLTKTLIQIGFKREDVEYGARFENSRVEMYYTLTHNKKISFLSKNIDFNKGDEIIVAVSYKYNEHDFKGFMKLYFDDVQVFTSPDKSYALAVCNK